VGCKCYKFHTEQQGDTEDLTFHIGLIDFERLTAPFGFGSVQPPLKVFAKINGTVSRNPADSATISGGSLVNATTFLPVDQSVVDGTKLSCEGCLPAITIQFVRKVSNFSVFLVKRDLCANACGGLRWLAVGDSVRPMLVWRDHGGAADRPGTLSV
jgi:hypothetical protein